MDTIGDIISVRNVFFKPSSPTMENVTRHFVVTDRPWTNMRGVIPFESAVTGRQFPDSYLNAHSFMEGHRKRNGDKREKDNYGYILYVP